MERNKGPETFHIYLNLFKKSYFQLMTHTDIRKPTNHMSKPSSYDATGYRYLNPYQPFLPTPWGRMTMVFPPRKPSRSTSHSATSTPRPRSIHRQKKKKPWQKPISGSSRPSIHPSRVPVSLLYPTQCPASTRYGHHLNFSFHIFPIHRPAKHPGPMGC